MFWSIAVSFFRLHMSVVACAAAALFLTATTVARASETSQPQTTLDDLQRVTTVVPYPRGLQVIDGELYVLARGRVRGAGGVSAEVNDQAGTLYIVNPNVTEPAATEQPGDAVRNNGRVFALPTDPPFKLWRRDADPPESDRDTDRPYCTLRWHEPTKSFYLCAFSGIDMPRRPGKPSFSKNLTDAMLRYDTRINAWREVDRHDPKAGWQYPHHDPAKNNPPHGWLRGANNCLPLGRWLYGVGKDNSVLIRYDLKPLETNPEAPAPESQLVLDEKITLTTGETVKLFGHSALAYHDRWLYIATRTSSVIFRIPMNEDMTPVTPIRAEIVAYFDPWDREANTSADLTDMDIDEQGRLYVISAKPSRVFRFTPDPAHPFDGRKGKSPAWADLAGMTDNPKMKSENVLVWNGHAYVTSGDGYGYQKGADGAVYRLPID